MARTRPQRQVPPPAPSVPWARFVRAADCACDDHPCLYHYALALDWRERTAARTRAGVREPYADRR